MPDRGGWDAENRAWVYLQEFVANNSGWFATLQPVATGIWNGWATQADLTTACLDLVNAAGERDDRFAEIIDQHDGESCLDYWLGMLKLDPSRQCKA